ncbi:MAG: aspartate aminotransferase family protein [Acidiphilium sp. 37-64-53]|uniref:aspartate aminotransferase family protein n=1 Tax=Acidiphilium TaxID=522 RepID=UPI000BC65EDB|nr:MULTISPECIES: aspartate aminotransferase family protein [Acidiphilium]OYW04158.1 MAG: aspartate aminotransferase family protein [Acidiphilium sp. 37-64-53]OZB31093.1 MAG: aspartate aminotransferase family protein [Acidiphilium sp. 34-64-41]HQT83403.1 aspartate aminotransferase family protein [Acidiphilium rubrum]
MLDHLVSTVSDSDFNWQAADAAHHLHPFSDHKSLHQGRVRIITSAEGVYLTDDVGNRILDGMAGLWCVAIGYGRQELVDAAAAQMKTLPFYNTFFKTATRPVISLAERLTAMAPGDLNHAFFACSGSEAVDTALRMARTFWITKGQPSKRVIIGREFGYHGSTTLGAAAGGMVDMHRQGAALPDFAHVMPPYWYGYGGQMSPEEFGLYAARQVEDKIREIGAENVAAFIGEPIQGAGGVIIPPETYWPEIQRICRAHDILLIADEVICGFGRTGRMFGSETFGITPDLMTLAKGITSGYIPLSAVLVGDRVADVLINDTGEFYHGFTYSGHPVACAVALANLDILESEHLAARAEASGIKLRAKLIAALGDQPIIGEIRGTGLIGAIELTADRRTRRFFEKRGRVGALCRDHCFSNNLVMRAVRDTMVFSPPLTITDAEIDDLVDRATTAIMATQADVRSEIL